METRGRYDPIRLNKTNRYAGYQFHAHVRADGMTVAEAFHYVVLTIYQWILKRIPEGDRNAPELRVPYPEEHASVTPETFKSYHLNIGFALDITAVPEQGIWALRIKETDQGSSTREAVIGRFFTTRVGVRQSDDDIELGIKIDVTDPVCEIREVDFAFRPAFVRSLATQGFIHFEQAGNLKYAGANSINTDEEYKRFIHTLENEDNQLPLVIFTYRRPWERALDKKMSVEEFVKTAQAKSFLQFSGVPAFDAMRFPDERLRSPKEEPKEPVMPFEADQFNRTVFAYARTYVLGDKYTDRFRKKTKKDFTPGDILLCDARKFGNTVSVIHCSGENEDALKKTYEKAQLEAQKYSKHKSAYDFGKIVFEAEARKMEQHARIMEMVSSSTLEAEDRIQILKQEMESLFEVINAKDEDIRRLNEQKNEAFDRGVELRDVEISTLQDENSQLKKELLEKQGSIDQMMNEFHRAREINNVIARMRAIDEIPEDNAGVIRFFRTVYADRVDFTTQGEKSAGACSLKPSSLWKILYTVANQLVDVLTDYPENAIEEEVQARTGYRMSFREGSMTRERTDMMRLRMDEYEGKEISIEPHLKLRAGKGEVMNQRLHFWFDQERKRVVIGYIGEHLDSASSWYR